MSKMLETASADRVTIACVGVAAFDKNEQYSPSVLVLILHLLLMMKLMMIRLFERMWRKAFGANSLLHSATQ